MPQHSNARILINGVLSRSHIHDLIPRPYSANPALRSLSIFSSLPSLVSARTCSSGASKVIQNTLLVLALLGVSSAPPTYASSGGFKLDVGNGPPINLPLVTDANITLDGELDEPAWDRLTPITNFVTVDPDTLKPGHLATRMFMFYTEKGLYLGAEMEQDPATLLERLSSRDQGRLNRDYFAFTLDTSGEARYGFWFQTSLGDSATDGTILPEARYSTNWDGAWQRSSKRNETGWSVEFFVPWSILSMPKNEGKRTLGIFASRRIAYLNERWGWPALPFTQSKFFSRYQKLEVENVSPRQQWAAFPYASITRDNIEKGTFYKAGAELFWRPSTNFQATASLNPDFGTVESDDVIVNFSANEVFFPERRLFFLEGQEIFTTTPRSDARRNFNPLTLVNTRRIGGSALEPDIPEDVEVTSNELNQPTELLAAIKATGQIGQMRYGVLSAFENDIKFDGAGPTTTGPNGEEIPGGDINLRQFGRDYNVVRALFEPDTGGAYIGVGMLSSAVTHPERDAYVHSVDAHYYTEDRKWNADAQIVVSDITGEGTGIGGFTDLRWVQRQGLEHNLQLEYFDADLNINDLGFQRRADTYGARYSFSNVNSSVEGLQSVRTSGFLGGGWNTANRLTLAGTNINQEYLFKSLNRVAWRLAYNPTRFEDRNSFGNGTYKINTRWDGRLELGTNNSRRLAATLVTRIQQEDLGGWSRTYRTGLTWRMSDRMTSELSVRHTERDAWLLHTGDDTMATFKGTSWSPNLTLDFFPTARQQFRVALQWVAIDAREQEFFRIPTAAGRLIEREKAAEEESDSFTVSRVNLQVRYRWEIAPLSDLFLVYTRASSLPNSPGSNFGELFSDSFDQPFAEQLVLKLRYRLGS